MIRFRIFLIALLLAGTSLAIHSADFADETLSYVVSYKWGIIHKDAGDATLTLRRRGDSFHIMLAAKTRRWADKFYKVRDTLLATVASDNFRPQRYVRIAHEDGKYSRDEIRYTYNAGITTGHCVRQRQRKGKTSVTEKVLTANGAAYDLLSIFYYLRLIDYSQIAKGKVVVSTIFSGKESETVKIKPIGLERITLRDKTKVDAYHIRFNFTTAGKKKSSDDIDAWLSNDGRRIPLLVVGQLPVGKIKCYYTGSH